MKWIKREHKGRHRLKKRAIDEAMAILLISELLSERCRANDLAPNAPILGLPPGSVNSEVLGLDVFINKLF